MEFLSFLSNFRFDFLDSFFRIVSYLGEATVLLPILCITFWCINKSLAYSALFSFFLSGSMVQGVKIVFRIPRPWVLNPDFKPVDSALKTATGYSFPSGHTQSNSSIFGVFAVWSKYKTVRVLSYIIIPLVLFSRMYLGVHTPKDVLTALLISVIVIFVLRRIQNNIDISDSAKLGMLILALFFCAGLTFYSYLLVRWNISTIEFVADAIEFAATFAGFAIATYLENKYINFSTKCFSIFQQFLKVLLGIGGLLAIKIGSNYLPFEHFVQKSIANFFICIWAICIFPIFIKMIQKKAYSEL